MKNCKPEIAPEEIRAIRKYLGLSQLEAGELVGGGPRAFTKYEAGVVKPSAAVINTLRRLEDDPRAVAGLEGRACRPIRFGPTSPFEVSGEHIAALTEQTFPLLLRLLLSAEAKANNLPAARIHVASNIYATDGGEDGRITWRLGPDHTLFLPSRLSQFQLKASEILPAAAAKDVLAKKHVAKDMVRSVLEVGGHYIMLCTHSYAWKQISAREAGIRKALRDAGLAIDDDQVEFRDADQIALWVNDHPSVATWLKEQTQPGTIGPFRSWSYWAGRTGYDQSPLVEDDRLPGLRDHLPNLVSEPRQFVRVVGLSGVGKTRLILEALGATEEEVSAGLFLSDLVMYAIQSQVGSHVINEIVQNLADSGARAVVVVDNCDPDNHQVLAGMVLRQSSRLSLVTIDNEIPTGTLDGNTLKVGEAAPSVTQGIINYLLPGIPYEDQSRLERFSEGFPEIAIRVGKAWSESRPIAHATDDGLVETFVLGRNPRNRELLLKSAPLLAVFGLVEVDSSANGQLSEVAKLGRNLGLDDIYAAVTRLVDRGVAQKRGRLVTIQPRPIAMRLAEQQWKEWPPATWERVLSGDTNPNLKVLAARQLALLNTTDVSRDVVSHVCRYGGPFDGLEAISRLGHAEVLSKLAEINSEVVANQIERSLEGIKDLTEVSGDVRRHLVWALEKIAFHTCTFDEGANLLLRLAAAEKRVLIRLSADDGFLRRSWDSNAASKFKGLFPMLLGATEADGDARLSFLDEAANIGDPAMRVVIAEGLIAGCETRHFERILGAEAQGSRSALDSWRPATNREASEYIKGCVRRLTQLACEEDEAGVAARAGLADAMSPLVLEGLISIDEVESVVHQLTARIDFWPEGMRSLRSVLIYHAEKIDPEVTERVKRLVDELQPKNLELRIRSLSNGIPWDYRDLRELDVNEQYQREVEAVRKLASEALQQPATLEVSLRRLSRGQPRMALEFGAAVAELADSPPKWLELLIEATEEAPENERNYDLLSGFVMGLAKGHPNELDIFKQRAARSRELAPAFLRVSWRFGITKSDIEMGIGALQDGLLTPRNFAEWSFGGKLAEISAREVATLFGTMLDHSAEGFTEAVHLMGMYAYGAPEKLEGLRPEVLKLAENAARWRLTRGWNKCQYHFELIMGWMLGKGRQNPDARATALALAKAVANIEGFNDAELIKPLLPRLLSDFPEIAWPLIGQAIISDARRASRLRYVLGDPYSFGRKTNPAILNLPEDTLFAWCDASPDAAPAFLALTIPVLAAQGVDAQKRSLHPVIARLLDEFGDRKDVLQAVGSNIHNFSWSGSRTTYYAPYKEPLGKLLHHTKPEVRRWAKTMIHQLNDAVANARNEDEEREALAGI